jgi:delta 1-pyrroline-5-carboxylate dehydrogenase
MLAGLQALRRWLAEQAQAAGASAGQSPGEPVAACDAFEHASPVGLNVVLAGPTGARDPARWPPDRLLVERSLTVNTAAAGGNAGLMTI